MRTLELDHAKLKELLEAKYPLVTEARKISSAIDVLELKIEKNKDKQRKYTSECEPTELIEKGNALAKEIEAKLTKLEETQKEIHKLKIANVPQAIGDEYESLKKQKEEKELERNKIAIKVQKIKDRATPIIQKLVKPALKEYDDIDTAELNKSGKIVVRIFNYQEQWQDAFKKKNA
jgi:predicted  nucleic acid-binding Zn-ribbon protein